eukprot:TRINITY_DN47257_c0_g1_i1.p1 TRINITY_DN47257_c0_g1~~TRINITY_DN47257_c0_g1_i1.p1  ORF type:complete len:163 (-),score=35.23 TRINITY_DN47257_c0_g1_i1:101-589(-)
MVRDAVLLSNVLHPDECRGIVALGEKLGFAPDEPAAVQQVSVLAHAFVWLAGDQFIAELWRRVQPLLCMPEAVGLNRRFRCYRYAPGAVYRPHIDGAWPPSGGEQGKYEYDVSGGTVLSKFTFLIYLNEDFTGGGTTFYAPSSHTEGTVSYTHLTLPTKRIV